MIGAPPAHLFSYVATVVLWFYPPLLLLITLTDFTANPSVAFEFLRYNDSLLTICMVNGYLPGMAIDME
ncbi:hypothetical protein Z042_09600 [Chania multitudinisentens RB-25]|uniref:Uncharacterized protein n=1 Tax=Chania multitudinisentens RB-25 TaxID=1441930 RepID=W0LK70_9GAMM|nr:hypothetical protein Z042_09600 [Chania multitudinisentens RB-25]